jgi:hypothetical protein|tara:strand:+ start:860 stop:1042 length:183 start_codon:yes stop_codon:yes gene_type:complete
MNTDNRIVEDEVARINAVTVRGSLEEMIQLDMESYSQDETEYAEARGWLQTGFNEMEIVE